MSQQVDQLIQFMDQAHRSSAMSILFRTNNWQTVDQTGWSNDAALASYIRRCTVIGTYLALNAFSIYQNTLLISFYSTHLSLRLFHLDIEWIFRTNHLLYVRTLLLGQLFPRKVQTLPLVPVRVRLSISKILDSSKKFGALS